MSTTCTSRSEFALLQYRWCSRSSVRYSDLHRLQKWLWTRCRNLTLLLSTLSLRPTSVVLSVGMNRILRPIIRRGNVSGSSIFIVYIRQWSWIQNHLVCFHQDIKFIKIQPSFRKHLQKPWVHHPLKQTTPPRDCLYINLHLIPSRWQPICARESFKVFHCYWHSRFVFLVLP